MNFINTISAQRFSLDGIDYFKNFLSKVNGNNITIYNAYDSSNVLVEAKIFSQINLNGIVHTSVAALQSALLPIIYTRNSLNGLVTQSTLFNYFSNISGFALLGQNLTLNAGWAWFIEGTPYSNPANVVLNIPFAVAGKKRIDIVVANANNTFQLIQGVEVLVANTPAEPIVPIGTIKTTTLIVNDSTGGISSPTVPITGNGSDATKEDIANKSQTVETDKASTTKYPSVKGIVDWIVARFQTILVSGTNIKTIGGVSLLGGGDIVISGTAKRIHKIEFSFAGGGFGQPSGFWWGCNDYSGKYNPSYLAASNLVPTNNFSAIVHNFGYKEKALFAGKIKRAFVGIHINGGSGYVFDVAIVNYKIPAGISTGVGFGYKIVARQSFTIDRSTADTVQSYMLPANIDSLYNIEENSFFALIFNTGVGSNNPIQNPQIYVELEEN